MVTWEAVDCRKNRDLLIGGSSPPRGPLFLRFATLYPFIGLGALEAQLKALTHSIFSMGVGLYLVLQIAHQPTPSSLLVIWLAFATNEAIDVLGHRNRGGRAVRSFVTHSIFTAPLWGVALAASSLYLADLATARTSTTDQFSMVVELGVIIAYSHLLLDALTEGGVFYWRRRLAVAHFDNNNEILNGAFAGLGVLLIAVAFY